MQGQSRRAAAGDLTADLLKFAGAFNTTVGSGSSGAEWVSTATTTACQWSGVTCNATSSTFSLDLSSQSLSGGSCWSSLELHLVLLLDCRHEHSLTRLMCLEGTLGADWFELPSFSNLTTISLHGNKVYQALTELPRLHSETPQDLTQTHHGRFLGRCQQAGPMHPWT